MARFIHTGIAILALCIFLLCSASKVAARTYTFVSLEYLPYSQLVDGVPEGFDVELMQECFSRMGEDLKILLVPWKRALHMAMHSYVDGVFGALETPERKDKLLYSDPVRIEHISFFVRKNSKITFDGDLNKLRKHSFGVISAFSYGKNLDRFFGNELTTGRVEQVIDTEMNIAKLIKGRFDILVGDHFSTMHTLRSLGLQDAVRSLEPPVAENKIYAAFSKERNLDHLRDRFNTALQSIREDGTWDKISQKYAD